MPRLVVFSLLLALLAAPVVVAQDDGGAATPRYIGIFFAHTQLGDQAAFEDSAKKLMAALKKAGADFPVFAATSVSSPGTYSFASPMMTMADYDAQDAVFAKVFTENPQLGADLSMHMTGNDSTVFAVRPDLWYVPENPRVPEAERNFGRVTFLYLKPAHAQEFEGVIKEFAALAKAKGINDGFEVYQGVMGEGPVFAVRNLAKSEADFYAQVAKNAAAMGAEGAALQQKAGPMVKRIEYNTAVRRPDLSYEP